MNDDRHPSEMSQASTYTDAVASVWAVATPLQIRNFEIVIKETNLAWRLREIVALLMCLYLTPFVLAQSPPAGTPGPTLANQTFYGAGFAMDSLANTTLNNSQVSYRFRSSHTGQLSAVRFYLIINHAGYSGGNNGNVQVNIETDDGTTNHYPTGTVLATYTIVRPSVNFPLVTFSSPPTLTANTLYHVVFVNTDPTPTVNYCSPDVILSQVPNGRTPAQPMVGDTDWIQLMNAGGGWQVRPGYSPILELDYADGFIGGVGYMENWNDSTKAISTGLQVREAFTVTGGNHTVSKVSLRIVSGSGGLAVRLETGSGTLIEQGTMVTSPAGNNWMDYTFSSPLVLTQGQSYNLVFSSSGSYNVFPIRRGSTYGFSALTYFSDGVAQFNPGSGWVGWDDAGVNNRQEQDLQFYFAIGQPSQPAPPSNLTVTTN